jgi:thiamine pyrophosphate-dependent acetolactate synthase large subunit-like protein
MDSSALLAITANIPTSQFNRAAFQETYWHFQADFPSVIRPYVKRSWQPTRVDMLPTTIRQAFATMLGGRPGPVNLDVPFNIPPTRLVHVDIDGEEIGRNYPVHLGIVGDVLTVLRQLLAAIEAPGPKAVAHDAWLADIAKWRAQWEEFVRPHETSEAEPMHPQRVVQALRATGSGRSPQATATSCRRSFEAVKAYATVGEICGTLRELFGEYRPAPVY